jgi:hypothetical protein
MSNAAPPIPVGTVFDRLTVIDDDSTLRLRNGRAYRCRCTCGAEVLRIGSALRAGRVRSCGCLLSESAAMCGAVMKRHDGRGTPTYETWKAMVGRCHNPRNRAYHRYGGRGISVCDRWRDFTAFLADMGERPSGLTIDRIDNDKGYEPGNCRWAGWHAQNQNRRSTKLDQASAAALRGATREEIRRIARDRGVTVHHATVVAHNPKHWKPADH